MRQQQGRKKEIKKEIPRVFVRYRGVADTEKEMCARVSLLCRSCYIHCAFFVEKEEEDDDDDVCVCQCRQKQNKRPATTPDRCAVCVVTDAVGPLAASQMLLPMASKSLAKTRWRAMRSIFHSLRTRYVDHRSTVSMPKTMLEKPRPHVMGTLVLVWKEEGMSGGVGRLPTRSPTYVPWRTSTSKRA